VVPKVRSDRSLIRSHINRYYFLRKHYGNAAVQAFRLIMSAGAVLRLLKYAGLWLVRPVRRPEAWPKVKAYWKIILLGAAAHPEELPDDLRRESAEFDVFRPAISR
jgi:hypothetical protein